MWSDKEVLRWLDGWREVALLVRTVLLWEKPSYPFALLGFNTLLFIELAYLEPRVLSVLCGVALCIVLLDYLVPKICVQFWKEEHWSPVKQAQLDHMAQSIASALAFIVTVWTGLLTTKNNSPSTYYLAVVPTLFISGWIGSNVNNLFLTYLTVTGLVMLPGLISRGLIDKYYRILLGYTVQVLQRFSYPVKKTN